MVKKPPANAGDATDVGSIPGSGRSPGVGSSILVWKIPWTEDTGRLYGPWGSQKSQTRLMPENTLCATCWGNSEQETKSLILLSLTVLDLQNPYSVVTVSDFQIEGKIEAQRWGCIVYLCLRHTASSMLMIL